MTPAARVQASIEILDEVIVAARGQGAAADTLIARYFRARRYAGSKDRRAVRELVYGAIRALGEVPESGRAAMLGYANVADPDLLQLFGAGGHGPSAIDPLESAAEAGYAPKWLETKLRPQFGKDGALEMAALLDRAPLDLRVNSLKAQRDEVLPQVEGAVRTQRAPCGLRLDQGLAIEDTQLFKGGIVEIQDEGSQLIALACMAKPGMRVIDLCAGAGGKTLALAADMENTGEIIAADTDRGRLQRLSPRAERAGISIVREVLLNPDQEMAVLEPYAGTADIVLIDAPCSGTGTWRRNPEARWRLTPERLMRLTKLQARLIDIGAQLVKPGGRLVYGVCSLLRVEGDGQATAFEARNAEFLPVEDLGFETSAPRVLLTPHSHGTDGFFIAGYKRAC